MFGPLSAISLALAGLPFLTGAVVGALAIGLAALLALEDGGAASGRDG
jgi:hypothetical protein